jgi:hypothetical protein
MTAKLTKNPSSFTAWSIERNKERRHQTEAQYKIGAVGATRAVTVGAGSEMDYVVLETDDNQCF